MKRPWKVSFRRNSKLQSCLALSLVLHLLVIFGLTRHELAITHPLYHCFYDVNSLPRGMRDMSFVVSGQDYPPRTPDYLEGIMVGEQLVGVYSMRGYADFWAGIGRELMDWSLANNVVNHSSLFSAEEPLVYNLGVNIVVYALTREGSLARQLVDAD